MTADVVTYRNGRIFNGRRLRDGYAAQFSDGQLTAFGPDAEVTVAGDTVDLNGDILSPGYIDLQVNGGGGLMFNDDPSVATLRQIAEAHRGLGVTTLLPTLITDSPDKTQAAIDAAIGAVRDHVPGIGGLHLEGPHLSVARKGAHDASLIRPMEQADLEALLQASKALPILKVTIAPENVGENQVAELVKAGVLVSLGHTDASYEVCNRYFEVGSRCVTHLFNAMSQLGNREPGLVGAALADGNVFAGLIGDGIHVHPQTIRAALAANIGPGQVFLVSDAMAAAGSDLTEFELGGRRIQRLDGRLTLADGTLAGADLTLTQAIKVLTNYVGVPLDWALGAATTVPSRVIGRPETVLGQTPCKLSDVCRIASDLSGAVALE